MKNIIFNEEFWKREREHFCKSAQKRSFMSRSDIKIINIREYYSEKEFEDLVERSKEMEWYQNIPGGYLKNKPNRMHTALGDGASYDEFGFTTTGWEHGHWTAAVCHNDTALQTETASLPNWLQKLGLLCRKLRKYLYGVDADNNIFNLAVCNRYCHESHEIKEHTDDNWYEKDADFGPLFASLTLYPKTKPKKKNEYARFQVKLDGCWESYCLEDVSVLFMPSSILHRVRSTKKELFHERINITLRSSPCITRDPLRCAQAVSNHSRYYRYRYR